MYLGLTEKQKNKLVNQTGTILNYNDFNYLVGKLKKLRNYPYEFEKITNRCHVFMNYKQWRRLKRILNIHI